MRLEDLAIVNMLEVAAFDELDRQLMTGELESGIAYETSYFDPVSGEIQGIPDFSKVIAAMIEALRDEGMMV